MLFHRATPGATINRLIAQAHHEARGHFVKLIDKTRSRAVETTPMLANVAVLFLPVVHKYLCAGSAISATEHTCTLYVLLLLLLLLPATALRLSLLEMYILRPRLPWVENAQKYRISNIEIRRVIFLRFPHKIISVSKNLILYGTYTYTAST